MAFLNISQKNNEALKNPWVLGLLGFLITFLSANAIFIYMAFEAAPSLVVEDFYERGERYLETQKQLEEEQALGWTGLFLLPAKARVNQTHTYEVLIHDQNSSALLLDSVVFYAYRPSDSDKDFYVEMNNTRPGIYSAELNFPLPGIWDLIAEVKQGENNFLVTKRIVISP